MAPAAPPNETFYQKFSRKAFSINTFGDVMDVSGGTMKRTLRGWQLLLLGVGTMVGAGVFVSTGSAAQDKAGPAITMSYLIAGLACALAALCYAEFSCDFPMAGGAFNFVTVTFGEFPGWLTACNLFITWTVANAAVGKGFSGYFCSLTGINPVIFTPITYDFIKPTADFAGFGIEINWLSLLFIGVLTVMMLFGTSESTLVQNISVLIYLVLILFIIVAGATQVDNSNYVPFAPYGIDGVFKGVTSIYFSYVGFDMVASMAEEAVNPAVDLPVGILGSLAAATGIYMAMSCVLTGMVSYADLDPNAPFATVFTVKGMEWAAKIVAIGALFGCTNSNYGGILGQSRIFVTMARAGLLPKPLAKMSEKQVPYWSVIWSGGLAGILALLLNLDSLWDFVSIGTLCAYGAVCLACLWRRYNVVGQTPVAHGRIMAGLLVGIIACGLWAGFGNQYQPGVNWMWAVPTGIFFPLAGAYHFFPQRYTPTSGFATPYLPWIPAGGVMMNCFLLGTLTQISFLFWGVWMFLSIILYLCYGMYHTQGEGGSASDEAPKTINNSSDDKSTAVELAKAEGAKASDLNKYSKASIYAKPSLPFDIGFIRDSTIQTKNA